MCQALCQDGDLVENKADLVLPSSPAVTLIHADINGVNSMRPKDMPWWGVGAGMGWGGRHPGGLCLC